MQVTKLPEKM